MTFDMTTWNQNTKKKDKHCKDVEIRFDTSTYELERLLLEGKNKKGYWINEGKLGGKLMTEFVSLRPKRYNYLIDDGKKAKNQKTQKSVSQNESLILKIIIIVLKQLNLKIK